MSSFFDDSSLADTPPFDSFQTGWLGFMVFVNFTAVIINSISIWLFFNTKKNRTHNDWMLVSLPCMDVAFTLYYGIHFSILLSSGYYSLGAPSCITQVLVIEAYLCIAGWVQAIIALERYSQICLQKKPTWKHYVALITITTFFVIFHMLMPLMFGEPIHLMSNGMFCLNSFRRPLSPTLIAMIVVCFVTTNTIQHSYLAVYKKINEIRNAFKKQGVNSESTASQTVGDSTLAAGTTIMNDKKSFDKERRAVRFCLLVLGMWATLWTPLFAMYFARAAFNFVNSDFEITVITIGLCAPAILPLAHMTNFYASYKAMKAKNASKGAGK